MCRFGSCWCCGASLQGDGEIEAMNKREWILDTVSKWVIAGGVSGLPAHEMADYVGKTYDAIVAASPESVDSGWIEHRGEKPYPEGAVEIEARSGSKGVVNADDMIWTHDGEPWDIIAWRPAT